MEELVNSVANKSDYLARLQVAISHLHGCGALWLESTPVHEIFNGQTVWQGDVEVFDLNGHPKARRCYAWANPEGPADTGELFVTVLELPPVISAVSAVRAHRGGFGER